MARLNQIIAVVNGKKAQAKKVEETVYHNAQKAPMFEGIARTYSPLDDDGETFPKEVKYVQYRAKTLFPPFVRRSRSCSTLQPPRIGRIARRSPMSL
jgi:hypothetical protein